MIAELGHFALILAFALAIAQTLLPLWGAQKGHGGAMAAAAPLAVTGFLLTALAFAALTRAFLTSDFSVALVAANSHSAKPWLYKWSGVWGNHEGSLLLWLLILTLYGALAAVFGRNLLGVVSIFFVTGLAAIYSGVCATLGELAAGHAKSRTYPDGSALSHIETVQNHLSAIYVRAAAARSLTLEAARAEADALPKILAARIFSAESAIECGRLAMRVGGGKAYNKALPIERFLRDAYAGQVMAPGVDVLNLWLGKILTDQPIP